LTLSDRLASEGYVVETASDGEAGLRSAASGAFDLIVLDVMLPRMNGFDVCREVRQRGVTTPILMLTARGQVVDKVVGLKLGADDYLTKPFGKAELLARISAIMRRADAASVGAGTGGGGPLEAGPLTIDPGRHEARIGAAVLNLTATEYRLLEALVRAGGDVVPHHRLVRAGWPAESDPDLLWLKPHIARLRAKVHKGGGPAIVAVRSVGYRIEA
jgi:DNA-binding response OmpR family regulator